MPHPIEKNKRRRGPPRIQAPDLQEFFGQASIREAKGHAGKDQKPFVLRPAKTRLGKICEFAKRMGHARMGPVFCGGLSHGAKIVADHVESHGFDVISVIGKAGGIPKEDIGLRGQDKIHPGAHASRFNPAAQAVIMNGKKVQCTLLPGLCVRHDCLFSNTQKPRQRSSL